MSKIQDPCNMDMSIDSTADLTSPSKSAATTPPVIHRILRVLEYTGTPEFIVDSINKRGVKGQVDIRGKGTIREAILGETPTLLSWSDSQSVGDALQAHEDAKDEKVSDLHNEAIQALQDLYAEQQERDEQRSRAIKGGFGNAD